MSLQLICTIIACFLNSILLVLIWTKSPVQTGKYRWLMTFTACFEIFWGLFDLPAEIIAHSAGCSFIVFRINYEDSVIGSQYSIILLMIYAGIFGASMAVFASHFIYRYGCIEKTFGTKCTSNWRFGFLFIVPLLYGVWWGTLVNIWWRANPDMDEYASIIVDCTVGLPIENVTYFGAKFYNFDKNETMSINLPAWIGVCQTSFMVTLIPLVLMHFPITIFFIGPMLTLDTDFTTYVVLNTIIMYPAIDPLPNFIIIKSYRESVKACVRTVLFLGPSNSQVVHNAYSMPSVNSIVNRVVT
nr:protein C18B10.7 [imported] - Caenorhabditis elegans [Caenorhabditis elegans]